MLQKFQLEKCEINPDPLQIIVVAVVFARSILMPVVDKISLYKENKAVADALNGNKSYGFGPMHL